MKRVYVSLMAAVAGLAIAVFSTPNVCGQATFGNVSGTVTDPAGAAIPNAQVSITDTERGETYQTKTNGSGNYTQTHLLAGQYKIVIAAAGFADLNATAVVQVDATTRVDGQMQIGKAATEVTVSGEAPLLIKDRAEVSTTLTATELERLPILDRNVTSLLVSLPGAGRSPTVQVCRPPRISRATFRRP